MKTTELRDLLEQGTTVFARRPAHGDTEVELLTIHKVAHGYAYGSSSDTHKTRWSVALVEQLDSAQAKVEGWARESRLARRTRQEGEALQVRISELLGQIPMQPEYTKGLSSSRTAVVRFSLHDLRKISMILGSYADKEHKA